MAINLAHYGTDFNASVNNKINGQAYALQWFRNYLGDTCRAVIRLKAALDSNNDNAIYEYSKHVINAYRTALLMRTTLVNDYGMNNAGIASGLNFLFGVDYSQELTQWNQLNTEFQALRDYVKNNRDAVTIVSNDTDGDDYSVPQNIKDNLALLVEPIFNTFEFV